MPGVGGSEGENSEEMGSLFMLGLRGHSKGVGVCSR